VKTMRLWGYRDRCLRSYETALGLATIGRILPASANSVRPIILVFAAHPDDDILGLGITLQRHAKNGHNIHVIYTTNGCGHLRRKGEIRESASIRYQEACSALAMMNIPACNISCLGYLDGRLYRYIPSIARDVRDILARIQPDMVFVHTIEGGHRDHDITGFVVQSVCKQLHFSEVYEWTEYNKDYPIGSTYIDFPQSPYVHGTVVERIESTEEERRIKNSMLLQHISQIKSMGFDEHMNHGEAIRRCDLSDLCPRLEYFWTKDKFRPQTLLRDISSYLTLHQST
jgi:LmbE family N-acetylglucosaminyl deacetylase